MRKVYKIMLLAVLLSVALFCLTGAYRAADQIQTAYAPYSFDTRRHFRLIKFNQPIGFKLVRMAHSMR